ncbi:hypothetical protein Bca4012_093460 [Brassica carinata]
MAWTWETESGVDKETDASKVDEGRDREPPLIVSVRVDAVSRAGDDMADDGDRDRESTTRPEPSFDFDVGDEDRGASIPDSMVRAREGLVERRREDAGASLFETIHHELAEFHVESLIRVSPFFRRLGARG